MKFQANDGQENWNGEVKRFRNFGGHYELYISARGSGITVFFGRASQGQWFIAVPDWNASVVVGNLRDTFYAAEKLGKAMDSEIDGSSVAYALTAFAESEGVEEVDGHQETLDNLKAAGYEPIE